MRIVFGIVMVTLGVGCNSKNTEEKKPNPTKQGNQQEQEIPNPILFLENAKIERIQVECVTLEKAIQVYYLHERHWPTSLDEIEKLVDGGKQKLLDPWGNLYQFEIATNDKNTESIQVFTVHQGKRITRKGVVVQ